MKFQKPPRTPLFFKVWFAVLALLAIVIIGGQLWAVTTLITNPSQIGRHIGEIVRGYQESQP